MTFANNHYSHVNQLLILRLQRTDERCCLCALSASHRQICFHRRSPQKCKPAKNHWRYNR